jgi:hypothetical protein
MRWLLWRLGLVELVWLKHRDNDDGWWVRRIVRRNNAGELYVWFYSNMIRLSYTDEYVFKYFDGVSSPKMKMATWRGSKVKSDLVKYKLEGKLLD